MVSGASCVVRRARVAAGLVLAGALAACHAPPPLDGQAVLREIREARLAGGAGAARLPAGPLGEAEAIRVALESSPAVQAARASVREAEGGVSAARAVDNPEFRVDDTWYRRGTDTLDRDVDKLAFDLRVKLPPLAELPARVEAARAAVAAARAQVGVEEGRVRADVKRAFARLAAAQGRVALMTRLVEARCEREAIAARSAAGGGAPATGAALARVAVGDARDRLGRAVEDEAAARALLGRTLGTGTPDAGRLQAGEAPACTAPPDDVAPLEDRVLADAPDVEARRARHQRAREEARAERLAWMPRLTFLEVGGSRSFLVGARSAQTGYEVEPRYAQWSVHAGLGLELPLWNFNRGRAQAAEARVDAEAARFRETLSTAVAGIHRSVARWRAAEARGRRAAKDTLPAAAEAWALAGKAAEAGRVPAQAALEAEERLLLARAARLEDLLDCREAEIEVEAAVGRTEGSR